MLATAGVATAANQVKGGNVPGTISANGGLAISFKVSTDGKHVFKMKVPQPPLFCSGGGPPPPQKPAKPVPISTAGTFTDTLQYVTSTGSVAATLKVTGTFHAHKKESGKAKVTWKGALVRRLRPLLDQGALAASGADEPRETVEGFVEA